MPISPRFNAADSDLQLESADGTLFKVHRINLEIHSQVFADAGGSAVASREDVVKLTEPGHVLELMLQYMYLQRQPDLEDIPFQVMAELAEAVEKYSVFAAMGVCSQRMRVWAEEYPIDVLVFAVRHKYDDIANECAPLALDRQVSKMIQFLPADIFPAWIQYVDQWVNLMQKEYARYGPLRHHRGVESYCEVWAENYAIIAHELGGRPHSLLKLTEILDRRLLLVANRGCEDCKREMSHWTKQTARDRKDLKKFTRFLYQ